MRHLTSWIWRWRRQQKWGHSHFETQWDPAGRYPSIKSRSLENSYESSPWTRVACKGGAKYVVRSRVPIVDCIGTDVRSMSTQRYSLSPTPIPIVPWDTCMERLKIRLGQTCGTNGTTSWTRCGVVGWDTANIGGTRGCSFPARLRDT